VGSTLKPSPKTKPLKLRSNKRTKGCALVHPPHLIFKNVFQARFGGKACDRTVQSGMDFEIDVVIIDGAEGTKIETGFLLGLGGPKSDRSMETDIFGYFDTTDPMVMFVF
jgi:hypothetical protein